MAELINTVDNDDRFMGRCPTGSAPRFAGGRHTQRWSHVMVLATEVIE